MKRLILSIAVVFGCFTATFAQSDKETTLNNTKSPHVVKNQMNHNLSTAKDAKTVQGVKTIQDYKEVKNADVPQPVKEAIANDFRGATISNAYANAQGDYKIVLATADAKKTTVVYNSKGEKIKNELKKQ